MEKESVIQILTDFTRTCDNNNLNIAASVKTTNHLDIICKPHAWSIQYDCLKVVYKERNVWIPFDSIALIIY